MGCLASKQVKSSSKYQNYFYQSSSPKKTNENSQHNINSNQNDLPEYQIPNQHTPNSDVKEDSNPMSTLKVLSNPDQNIENISFYSFLAPDSKNDVSQLFPNQGTSFYSDIEKYFFFGDIIGDGHFGIVRKANMKGGNSNVTYAIKTIPKEKISNEEKHLLHNEIEILANADHPNIVKFFYSFQDPHYYHLVMEYLEGGELFEHIYRKKGFDENLAAKIISQIVSAINYLHSKNIIHRDIKPENFIFTHNETIKMIDFGLSKKFGEKNMPETGKIFGTPYYMAPEVLTGVYTTSCDMWALGVLLYIMLSGYPPFNGNTNQEIFMNIILNEPKFKGESWKNISDLCIDFIKKCLTFEVAERISAKEALEHQWLNRINPEIEIDPLIVEKLLTYHSPNKFKREALRILIKYLSDREIKKLIQTFQSLDVEKTGYITYQNLEFIIRNQFSNNNAADEIKEIILHFEPNNEKDTDKICYTDFIIATMDKKYYSNKNLILNAFRHFDLENKGYITEEDIKNAISYKNDQELDSELKKIIELNPEKNITFDQFYNLLIKENEDAITMETLTPSKDLQIEAIKSGEKRAEKIFAYRKNSIINGFSRSQTKKMYKAMEIAQHCLCANS